MIIRSFFCLILTALSLYSYAQCDPVPGALYGSPNTDERGHTLVSKPGNDGFYVSGSKGDSLLLLELDANGNVLSTTTFDLFPGVTEFPSDIIIDSEGMIAIVGSSRTEQLGGELFIMRYNASLGQILWLKHYENAPVHNTYSIIEKGDNGNYLVAVDANFTAQSHNDAWLFEVEKNSGNVNLAFSKNYIMFNTETIYDILYKDNFVYAVGRFKGGGDVSQFRNAVLKLNAANGDPVWVKLGHKAENDAARLYGLGAVLDEDALVSIIWGDPDGTSVTNTEIFVQRTDLNGNLLWINRYDIPGPNDIPRTIFKVDGGFVILANQLANNDMVMFKIDETGDLLWGKVYEFPTLAQINSKSGLTQLIQVGDNLIFTGYGSSMPGLNDMIIVRTDLQGNVVDACVESRATTILVENVESVFYNVQPQINEVQPVITDLHTPVTASSMQATCFSTDTVFTTISEEICSGDSFEGYTTTGVFDDVFVTPNGCDSVRTLHLKVLNCIPIIHYDLEACNANMDFGTQMDYSEFTPDYPNSLSCAQVSAGNVHRDPAQEQKHSCTPGVNGSVAMCVSSYNPCTYAPGNPASIIIEFTLTTPNADSIVRFTGFNFYQKSPLNYNWINGDSGINNYPRKYGIRILKNGTEIFQQSEINTSQDWTLQTFNFIDNDDFRVNGNTNFRIELLPYCPIGNTSAVSAWDVDEITIFGGCVPPNPVGSILIGKVSDKNGVLMQGVDIALWKKEITDNPEFTLTDNAGEYSFGEFQNGTALFIKGHKDDDPRNGVSTLDLIHIQKHLLGIKPFDSLHQFIAADANRSLTVSAIDLVTLRKLLLGVIDSFPSNTSWRFGVAPLNGNSSDMQLFNELQYIESIQPGNTVIDFVGIKIGDLTNDAVANLSGSSTHKSPPALVIHHTVQPGSNGTATAVDFHAERSTHVSGIQFAMQLNELELLSVESDLLNLSSENYYVSEDGILTFSWSSAEPFAINPADVLFTITFMNYNEGRSNRGFVATEDCLLAEAYEGTQLSPLKIKFADLTSVSPHPVSTFTADPNPFTTGIDLKFESVVDGNIQIRMFDSSGRVLYSSEEFYNTGNHLLHVNGDQIALKEGLIFIQLISEDFTLVHRVIRI